MKEKNMKKVKGFPPLTEEEKKQLESLAALPESEIDTSESPEWTVKDFAQAIPLKGRSVFEVMKLYKVRKAPITARIDLDVLEWLKSQGGGYQTRMNSILREAMLKDLQQDHQK